MEPIRKLIVWANTSGHTGVHMEVTFPDGRHQRYARVSPEQIAEATAALDFTLNGGGE